MHDFETFVRKLYLYFIFRNYVMFIIAVYEKKSSDYLFPMHFALLVSTYFGSREDVFTFKIVESYFTFKSVPDF